MRWTNASHSTVHRCGTATSFSTNSLRCCMKHSLQRENSARFVTLTISLSRCQPDLFLRPLPPQSWRYSFVPANPLHLPCRGFRSTAPHRHTSHLPLSPIEFA